mmetsp:Transcript_85309/g.275318  ORF Transcript_85309/g.275318 Transcript_85309/m.275318 type:complete len:208 (-) Transcript_85309:79-702(-)
MGLACTREQGLEGGARTAEELVPVTLHVYDIGSGGGGSALNRLLKPLGLGAFHCGVEVHQWEWSYSDISDVRPSTTGVFSGLPRSCAGHSYMQSIPMGKSSIPEDDLHGLVEMMERDWTVGEYDLLRHNCCHFCNELCLRLGVGGIPPWVMSLAGAGDALVSGQENLSDLTCCRMVVEGCCRQGCNLNDEYVEAIPVLTLSVIKVPA